VRWILSEGRIEALGDDPAREVGRPVRFIDALCPRLVSAGVPLGRVTVYAATLHPQVRGFGWRWRRDGRGAEEVHIAQDMELTDDLQQSPLRGTIEQGLTLRWRIDGGHSVSPQFRKFRANGCTEYLTARSIASAEVSR
jgi:adenylate cyclase